MVGGGRGEWKREYGGGGVPGPRFGGGYGVEPGEMDLGGGGETGLPARLVYRRSGDGWRIERLQP